MSKSQKVQELKASVLDRLIDATTSQEGKVVHAVSMARIRDGIRQDLENLLNTRRPYHHGMKNLAKQDLTIVDYGVPDFTGASFSTQDEQEVLVREIRRVVESYEKRFKGVRITERKKMNSLDRTVEFRIEADLRVEPAVEPLIFDTRIDPVSRELNIEDASDG